MEELVALLDKVIEQHKVISANLEKLEKIVNDATALAAMEKAKQAFMPGRFDQQEGLVKLADWLEMVASGLDHHFNLEETVLLPMVQKYAEPEIVGSLRSIFLEHADLRHRMVQGKKHVAELRAGNMSRHVWEATAHDSRAHTAHTRKLLEAHAQIEMEIYVSLKNYLKAKLQKE